MSTYIRYEGLGTTRTCLGSHEIVVPNKHEIDEVRNHLTNNASYQTLSYEAKQNYLDILRYMEADNMIIQTWDKGFVLNQKELNIIPLAEGRFLRNGKRY